MNMLKPIVWTWQTGQSRQMLRLFSRRIFTARNFSTTLGPRKQDGSMVNPVILSSPPTPKEDRAKQTVSVAIYNHYFRIFQRMLEPDNESVFQKSNILLVGPSGTGKTLLAKTAANILHVPFSMADATGFTEAGYVGEDVDIMLYRLLEATGFNLGAAQRGIVFLDEVDKLAKAHMSPLHGGKDVGGQGVQQALLKMIEGSSVDVKDRRKGGERITIPFDTSSLLFIFSGAFNGLDEIVQNRLSRKSIGFSGGRTQTDAGLHGRDARIMATDLAEFGLIPEFVGRIPVVAKLEVLDQDSLERILTEPTGSLISQYKSLFAFNNVSLEFAPEAISAIAGLALRLEVGARGLRSILEGLLQDLMYEVPKSGIARIRIDADVVETGKRPMVEYHQSALTEEPLSKKK